MKAININNNDSNEKYDKFKKQNKIKLFIKSNIIIFVILMVIIINIIISIYQERGFSYDLTQCIFKSVNSVNNYYKKDNKKYDSVSSVFLHKNDLSDSKLGFFSKNLPTDKYTDHFYIHVYDLLLKKYLNKKNLNILEIGVKKGGSIKMW